MARLSKKTIVIFILLVVALYVVIEVVPSVTGALTGTETLEYGELKVSVPVNGWIVRDETVYNASKDGKMKGFADEGTLVKRGSKVVDFTVTDDGEEIDTNGDEAGAKYKGIRERLGDDLIADKNQKAQRKGIFSCYIDGYENLLTPGNVKKLTTTDVNGIDDQPKDLKREKARAGEPIYKIADNSSWLMLFWIDDKDVGKFEKGNPVKIAFEDDVIEAKVNSVDQDAKRWRVSVSTSRYYKDLMKLRSAKVEIVTTDREGLLISNKCLTTKDGKVGCYVKTTTGEYIFREVQTLATDGAKTLVTETQFFDKDGQVVDTVKAYDEVLTNPKEEE